MTFKRWHLSQESNASCAKYIEFMTVSRAADISFCLWAAWPMCLASLEWSRNMGMFSKASTGVAWTEENHHVKIPQGLFLVQGRPGSKCDLVLRASLYKSWCWQRVPFWRIPVFSSCALAHYWNSHMHFIHRVMMISSYPTLFLPWSCTSCPVSSQSDSQCY